MEIERGRGYVGNEKKEEARQPILGDDVTKGWFERRLAEFMLTSCRWKYLTLIVFLEETVAKVNE